MFFQIAALMVLALFYGCYLYKMIVQKRSGIETDQMGKGKAGMAKGIEVVMKLATYLVVVVEVVSIILDTSRFPIAVRIVGLILAGLGLAFFILAVYTMADNWRAGVSPSDETALVTTGVFRFSRDPAFLGFDLVYMGLVLMFCNIPLLFVSIFACLMFHLQIVYNEEPFLLETFGEDYLAYQKHTSRYFGRR